MTTKKMASDEVKEVTQIRQLFAELTQQMGVIAISEEQLRKEKEIVLKGIEQLQDREEKFLESIRQKYGAGTIQLESGEFIPDTNE